MRSFFQKITFSPIDPLANGLAEEIAYEQSEPDAITLDDQLDSSLGAHWEAILEEAREDPDYFDVINPNDDY